MSSSHEFSHEPPLFLFRPQRGSVGENGGDEVRSRLWSVPTPEGQCLAVSGGRERSAFGAEWKESFGGGE
ncbi:unnamed protein product [Rangifer tarandus platyrhynchus]|uniref:Uncharacterized protein n=2 Tax=Rangifer tarandus platyrhynchus TaxID=3082113 RepID=A0ACB0ENS1_RANTA|nr:unnamed protein product [Rangifer tarandus platyrhynchus]CAI9702345.1 unnamed protein product [Rangifer tarandus platyrhynchus]